MERICKRKMDSGFKCDLEELESILYDLGTAIEMIATARDAVDDEEEDYEIIFADSGFRWEFYQKLQNDEEYSADYYANDLDDVECSADLSVSTIRKQLKDVSRAL